LAESALTKEIKESLRGYAPRMPSKMRTIRWAEEVDVGTGFVDSIRFEDYIVRTHGEYSCRLTECKIKGLCFPNDNCRNCVHKHNGTCHELGIAMTCFEVKITKSDFKSKNGHNFVGNFNYYVIPKELYLDVAGLVPEDIGIILYHGHGYLKKKKECTFKEVDKGDLSSYLYNALKKWVDQYPLMLSGIV